METTNEKFKIRLGLFVLISLGLFAGTIFIIGRQKQLFDPVFTLTTTFYNVSGLQVGNNVRFLGINVGTVSKMHIVNDSNVWVEMLIKKSTQEFIKSDAEVGIGSEGIIGDRILLLSTGSTSAKSVENGEHLFSSEPVETDAIIQSIEITAVNAELISQQLTDILGDVSSGKGTLGRLIQDSTIADNLSKTMKNLESSSKGLDQNLEAAKDNIMLRGYFKRKKKDALKKQEILNQKVKDKKEGKK